MLHRKLHLIDYLIYTKYFFYFIYFLVIFSNNFLFYKVFGYFNQTLVYLLHNSINLNGCILIKFVQWMHTNTSLIIEKDYEYINKLFSTYYESCYIHNFNYTKKKFLEDFDEELENVIDIDFDYPIKSGSIAQVYKGKFKNSSKDIAIKVVHPQIKYQVIFPIYFIKLYIYIVSNISFLNKYDSIFVFDNFFESLKNQTNMITEYNNLSYFYKTYSDNEFIVVPRPIISSKNILIMDFHNGKNIDEFDISFFEKQKIIMLLNLFIKDNYITLDYFHSDLHDSNWKIVKDDDIYKIVIYDFGYVIKNDMKKLYMDLLTYTDTDNIDELIKILYEYVINVDVDFDTFKNNFYNYFNLDFNKQLVNDKNILAIVNFLNRYKYKLYHNLFEIFISLTLFKQYINKYIPVKNYVDESNLIIDNYTYYLSFIKKHNIFHNLMDYIENHYFSNDDIQKKYKYSNKSFDAIEAVNVSENNIDI
tara:strand:+ start:2785 stop:4209 length:1425 start_codon:yes stop_codon:yes gene_type:complete